MHVGLIIPKFSWRGGPAAIGARLGEVVRLAEAVGYDSIWVVDHFFGLPKLGPIDDAMLEAYTTLGYVAGQTSRVKLGTLVTGVAYHHPGVLIKQVTALDVVSGGRAYLGIGAGWYEREHLGLGVPFPPRRERFERLEEALQIAHQMWSDNNGPYYGKHYQLAETLNSPQSVTQPHPPILVGGGGEQKTLRFVARYADACNVYLPPDPAFARHKLDVLRQRCEEEGRDYGKIEKTVTLRMDLGRPGVTPSQIVDEVARYAALGFQTVTAAVPRVAALTPLEIVGRDVLPALARL